MASDDNDFERTVKPPELCAMRGSRLTRVEHQVGDITNTMRAVASAQETLNTRICLLLWWVGISFPASIGIVGWLISAQGRH